MAFGEKKAATMACPMCDVDMQLSGDEAPGDQLMCLYCQTPLKIKKNKEDQLFFEEDY